MAQGLMLHVDTKDATREAVMAIPTPEPTKIWRPIPHNTLIETTEKQITGLGLEIVKEQFGLRRDGDRFFATMDVVDPAGLVDNPDHGLVIGLRNSHDQSFPAGLAVGSRVFVCDNLAFSGEIVVSRKHTTHIMDDLDRLVAEAFGRLGEARELQEKRIDAYKNTDFNDERVNDFLVRSVDTKVLPITKLMWVLDEWRKPEHDDFKPRTAWSLFNAYTEVFKGLSIGEVQHRTLRLHGMMDGACGLLQQEAPSLN